MQQQWPNPEPAPLGTVVSEDELKRGVLQRRNIRVGGMLLVGVWAIVSVMASSVPALEPYGLLIWLAGTAVIVIVAERLHRHAGRDHDTDVLLSADGQRIAAKPVGQAWAERRSAAGLLAFGTYLLCGKAAQLLFGDDAPLPLVFGVAFAATFAVYWYVRRAMRASGAV